MLREEVVPARVPPSTHSPYRAGYDWLFVFERRLARALDPWLRARRAELFGPGGLVSEALCNAFCHGHRKDPTRPITVQVWKGRRGLLLRIEDTGPGFAVEELLGRLERGEPYYHFAGRGLQRMVSSPMTVFFGEGGRAFHLVHRFDASDRDEPPPGTGGRRER